MKVKRIVIYIFFCYYYENGVIISKLLTAPIILLPKHSRFLTAKLRARSLANSSWHNSTDFNRAKQIYSS